MIVLTRLNLYLLLIIYSIVTALASDEIKLPSKLELVCASGSVFARVEITNNSKIVIKLNKFSIGQNGYIFYNTFKVKDLKSNKMIYFSGLMPEIILNENIYVSIEPNKKFIEWYDLSKLYSLRQNNRYSIRYYVESYHHDTKHPLYIIASPPKIISCDTWLKMNEVTDTESTRTQDDTYSGTGTH